MFVDKDGMFSTRIVAKYKGISDSGTVARGGFAVAAVPTTGAVARDVDAAMGDGNSSDALRTFEILDAADSKAPPGPFEGRASTEP